MMFFLKSPLVLPNNVEEDVAKAVYDIPENAVGLVVCGSKILFVFADGTTSTISTPVRGVDYWTDEDKAEIKSYVNEAILGGEW